MRQNITMALLVLCATLLGANLLVSWSESSRYPVAFGQAGGNVMMAASNTQNDAFCFVYDSSARQLAAYQIRTNGGLELKAVRSCAFDFNSMPNFEYPRSNRPTAVKNMKKVVDQISKQQ